MPESTDPCQWCVEADDAGKRLDHFLAPRLPQFSRSILRRMVDADGVQVDGRRAKVAYRLKEGQQVTFRATEVPRDRPEPQDIPLDILYEDDYLAAINKPPGMVVHPAKGHWDGTLASALSFHFDTLSTTGGPTRPGIVHRLDRDTSGVIVVAKTDLAHLHLARQFEQRTTKKEYVALVLGVPDRDHDVIAEPIGPHAYHRQRMAIRRDHADARDATTAYEVVERFDRFASITVKPKTGRTHQIRVHMAHVGHPVLCDRLYGGRSQLTRGELTGDTDDTEIVLERQALHARRLTVTHPATDALLEIEAPMPDDLTTVLELLREA